MLYYNYLLFDAARAEMNLYKAMELNPEHRSLYKGSAEEDLAGIAPYLFTIKEDTPFAEWYFKEGWGKSWGTLVFANAAFDDVYKHFRRFLMVKTEDDKKLYFRFYDPRVLRLFLPTCDAQQLRDLFGPVRHYITEHEKNPDEAVEFWLENTLLKTKIIPLPGSVAKPESNTENTAADSSTNNTSTTPTPEDKPKKKWKFYLDE